MINIQLSVRFIYLFGFQWTFRVTFFEKKGNQRNFNNEFLYCLGTFCVPWWRWWDSNPWPPACRAGALPAELHPHIGFCFFSVLESSSRRDFVGSQVVTTVCLCLCLAGTLSFPSWLFVPSFLLLHSLSSLFSLDESTRSPSAIFLFFQSLWLCGRPKWTRTTDLVLIRHAL